MDKILSVQLRTNILYFKYKYFIYKVTKIYLKNCTIQLRLQDRDVYSFAYSHTTSNRNPYFRLQITMNTIFKKNSLLIIYFQFIINIFYFSPLHLYLPPSNKLKNFFFYPFFTIYKVEIFLHLFFYSHIRTFTKIIFIKFSNF